MTFRFPHALLAACTLALALAAAPAKAGLFRTYLSASGSDANDCSVTHPCRLLPAALAAVNPGGEVWMLDSANFNTGTVNVTQSVTILAIPGSLGSLVVNGSDALVIDTPGVTVTLRNLSFGFLATGGVGIRFSQGASLLVEGCRFSNLDSAGIFATASQGLMMVRNSVFRNNVVGLSIGNEVQVALDRVQVIDSSLRGIVISDNAIVSLSNSTVSGSGDVGVYASATAGGGIALAIDRSTIAGNTNVGVYASASTAGPGTTASITRSIISGSTTGAGANQSGGGVAMLILDDSTISNNTSFGVQLQGSATLLSRENNNFNFNGLDFTGGGPTTLAGQ
jgi:hypothetical protein